MPFLTNFKRVLANYGWNDDCAIGRGCTAGIPTVNHCIICQRDIDIGRGLLRTTPRQALDQDRRRPPSTEDSPEHRQDSRSDCQPALASLLETMVKSPESVSIPMRPQAIGQDNARSPSTVTTNVLLLSEISRTVLLAVIFARNFWKDFRLSDFPNRNRDQALALSHRPSFAPSFLLSLSGDFRLFRGGLPVNG